MCVPSVPKPSSWPAPFPPPHLASVGPVPSGRKVGLGALTTYGCRAGSFPGLLLTPVPKAESSSVPSPRPVPSSPQSFHSTSHSTPGSRPTSFPSPGWNAAVSGPSLSLSDLASERRALNSTPSCFIPGHPAPGLPALQSLYLYFWGKWELLAAAGAGGPGPSAPPRQPSPSSHCSLAGPEAGVAESSEADNPR